jgi:hypothetical protein
MKPRVALFKFSNHPIRDRLNFEAPLNTGTTATSYLYGYLYSMGPFCLHIIYASNNPKAFDPRNKVP